jgi:diguanylate cyclase (GGDEF)-like protein
MLVCSAFVAKKAADLTAAVLRLSRRNAALRKEIAQLRVYRSMAYRDPLTGLWNRRFFQERLNEELSRSQRAGSSRKFSVMVVDLNDFKATNDRYGHPMGDAVLKDAGAFLVNHLRHHDVACRTGGDEFSVLLPDLSAEDCGHLVGRLRAALAELNAKRRIPISFSLGTASWPDAGDTAEALEARADEAMYADKRRHKSEKPIDLPTAAARSRTAKRTVARPTARRGRATMSAARSA